VLDRKSSGSREFSLSPEIYIRILQNKIEKIAFEKYI